MNTTATVDGDLETLGKLNAEYLHSDQYQDVKRYREILAEDFTATLPDYKIRNKEEFLEMIAAGRPFTDLEADDVRIRVLGDFALIHGHITFKTLSGKSREGRYTDDWQRRDGRWVCIAANVTAEPTD